MMKQRSTIIADIGQMAKGAASLVDDMRSDVKNMMNAREERSQNNANFRSNPPEKQQRLGAVSGALCINQ